MIDWRRLPIVSLLAAGERGGSRQINRGPSHLLAVCLPWASVMLGSILTTMLWIASAPLMPPLGLMLLIGWRQLRPGVLPVWAGVPLGAFDDLYSGQPFGSGVLLWSAAMLLLDLIEARLAWRSLVVDWVVAALLLTAAILLGCGLASLAGARMPLVLTLPQILVAILLYPPAGRLVGALDRLRLLRIVEIDRWR